MKPFLVKPGLTIEPNALHCSNAFHTIRGICLCLVYHNLGFILSTCTPSREQIHTNVVFLSKDTLVIVANYRRCSSGGKKKEKEHLLLDF